MSRRRILRGLLEWGGVLLVTLVVAEVALRVVLDVRPLTPGQFLFEHHPTRGWTHRAGATDLYVKLGCRQEIEINARGLRERDIPYERTPGKRRILVIGDSHVVGFEVAQEETFTRVAERTLLAAGHDVEIVNGGFRGYGTDQALVFLREEGVRYEPDLILYHWGLNDAEDNMTLHRPFRAYSKGYFRLGEDGRPVAMGVPVKRYSHDLAAKVGEDGEVVEYGLPWSTWTMLWIRDLTVTRSSLATALVNIVAVMPSFWQGLRGVAAYEDFQPEFDRKAPIFLLTAGLVEEIVRTGTESGADVRVVGAIGEWGRALREELGLPDLGVHGRFAASIPKGAELIVPFDSHLNALGHRLYGEALAEALIAADLAGPRGVALDTAPGRE